MADAPHDALFRFAFTQPAVLTDHLRALLPAELTTAIRWDTLALESGSFVDEELKQVHSDVLHSVRLAGGQELWLYVLFEHQSTVDPQMAWRLLRYTVRIWERALVERGGSELPAVLPLVLYTGERPWTASEDLDALFAHQDTTEAVQDFLRPYGPRFRYLLQDLSRLPDEALRGLVFREAVLLAFKHARDGSVWDLPRWLDLVVAVATTDGLRAVEALWRYVLTVAPTPPPPEVRARLTERLPPEAERLIMGYGERLLQQGREEGRAEGRAEGLLQGKVGVLLKLLQLRFGPIDDEVARRVEGGTEDELERWTERVVTEASLDAVLGWGS